MTQDEALTILKSGASVFLTGEPGSGKSYVASRYVSHMRKQGASVSVTASTGIAAAQLGGTTVHAWSGIGPKAQISRADLDAISKNRRVADRVRKTQVLVIDEISMLSGQTLSSIGQVCQHLRKSNEPFGGLQVLLVGDFFQLPPVVRRDERAGPQEESQDPDDLSPFAHASRAWRDLDPAICYLTEQHRQTDTEFSALLAEIRSNRCGEAGRDLLHSRRVRADTLPASVTRLFTHNVDVDRINQAELAKLDGEARSFFMTSVGDKTLAEGLKRGCLSPEKLDLKIGATVMFTKNDPEGRYVNGTLGTVAGFDEEEGFPVVAARHGGLVMAKPADWKVSEDDSVKAGITQVPLRLAWAITVHKSQGMSLDAAVIDLMNAFEYGQGYVALSRVRSLGGLHLLGWNERALRVHPDALAKDASFRRASDLERERLAEMTIAKKAAQLTRFENAAPGALSSAKQTDVPRNGAAQKKWSSAEDMEATARYTRGESVKAIAAALGRPEGGVRTRLVKLGLILK